MRCAPADRLADVGNAIWLNSFAGAHDAAISIAQRLVEQSPNLAESPFQLALAYSFAGEPEAAIPNFEASLELDATNLVGRMYLCMALAATGRASEAERQLEFLGELAGNGPLMVADVMAATYARLGRNGEAQRLANEILASDAEVEDLGTTSLAYLALGDPDNLAQLLERAMAKAQRHEPDPGFYSLMIIKHNVPHDPILDEPRFVELREALGRE